MGDALEKLNAEQRAAVTHEGGPLMVLAGPGTGKTRVITHRIAHLMQERGVDPERIVAVTYTTKAAQQLRDRLRELVGARADGVHAHTFHGLGYRIVRRFADEIDVSLAGFGDAGRGIIDSAQQRKALRDIVVEKGLFTHARAQGLDAVVTRLIAMQSVLTDSAISAAEAGAFVERAEQAIAGGTNVVGAPLDEQGLLAERARVQELKEAAIALRAFEKVCRERGWLGFGDLIALPIRILRKGKHAAAILRDEWRHMVVDEFQDVNTAQIELLRAIMPAKPEGSSGDGPDLCVVGDDDQSIYGFRGADDRAFQRFAMLWPGAKTIELTKNYRSTPSIVAVTNATIARAEQRFAPNKVIEAAAEQKSEPGPVECVHLDDDAQAGEVIAAAILADRSTRPESDRSWKRYAVVAKTHLDAERVRAALEIEGMPTLVAREGTPLEDEGVQDVLAWVELLAEPHSAHAAMRIMRRPPHSIEVAHVLRLLSRYRVALSKYQSGDPGAPDPGGVADWLERGFAGEASVARFVAAHATLRNDAATQPACVLVERIIAHEDAAHADLLSGRERAARVVNLVALVKFARERQTRLDPPGDVRALWSYWQDLSDDDRKLKDSTGEERIDGMRPDEENDGVNAVRIVTAHSSKGLEFEVVFVPRVSPSHGYGAAKEREAPEFPAGLIHAEDDRSEKEKARAEARRLFYVACTRAEKRLVLFSKKAKGISKSEHYFQQITLNDGLKKSTVVRDGADLLREAARIGTRRVIGWAGDLGASGTGPGYKTIEQRREAFEDAKREVRREAAGALDAVSDGKGLGEDGQRAIKALRESGEKMAALAEAERINAVPAWARGSVAGEVAERVLKRAESGEKEADGPAWPGLNAPIKLSYTAVDQYLRCPRCFYLRQVLHLKPLPGAAQIVGIAVHEAMELFYKQWREADVGEVPKPTRARLIELGRQSFARNWPRQTEVDRKQLDQVVSQLGVAFDRLVSTQGEDAQVLELEQWIEFTYGAHTFNAKVDRIEQYTRSDGSGGFRIVDYKTGSARKDLRVPKEDDLQLGVYVLALAHHLKTGDPIEQPIAGEAQYWLLSTGERGTLDFAAMDLAGVRAEIDGVIDGMMKGKWEKGKKCKGECDLLGLDLTAADAAEPVLDDVREYDDDEGTRDE